MAGSHCSHYHLLHRWDRIHHRVRTGILARRVLYSPGIADILCGRALPGHPYLAFQSFLLLGIAHKWSFADFQALRQTLDLPGCAGSALCAATFDFGKCGVKLGESPLVFEAVHFGFDQLIIWKNDSNLYFF